MTVKDPVKPDYSQPWVLGWEYVSQEGTNFWRELREERGWSREDVWQISDGMLPPTLQAVFEWDDHPGFPDLDQLVELAVIYGTSPGALLDRCYEQEGRKRLSCPRCHGDGEIQVNTSRNRDPQEDRSERCPDCHGTGEGQAA